MLRIIKYLVITLITLLLLSCQKNDKNTIRVGTIAGPETELMETAKDVAKKQFGLNIKIVEFTEYTQPNAALNDGSLEANMFQHQPYLDQEMQNKHYDLVVIGRTFVYPMGIYSNKIKNLADLPQDGTIAIPNDPTNEGRALILLEKAGIIRLKKEAGIYATPADIEANPRQIKFQELDAAQIPRSLPDVDAAVVNTNYALAAGLKLADALFHESKNSPYANIIVIRADEQNDPRMKQLIAAFQSEAVKKEAQRIFKDQAIPAW